MTAVGRPAYAFSFRPFERRGHETLMSVTGETRKTSETGGGEQLT